MTFTFYPQSKLFWSNNEALLPVVTLKSCLCNCKIFISCRLISFNGVVRQLFTRCVNRLQKSLWDKACVSGLHLVLMHTTRDIYQRHHDLEVQKLPLHPYPIVSFIKCIQCWYFCLIMRLYDLLIPGQKSSSQNRWSIVAVSLDMF